MKSHDNIIVFDIGGTWFRNGIYTHDGKLILVSKQPAKNYKNTKYNTIQELQKELVIYINEKIDRLRNAFPNKSITKVGISMGAALNAHTGKILNSGPLWGPDCLPIDLYSLIQRTYPGINFSIINDVSAALLREVNEEKKSNYSKIMLITVSTGIACRVFDVQKGKIPVDRIHGIQGEIGHLPIRFTYNNRNLTSVCDCGGKNHLNAFCSGRGIENVLRIIGNKDLSIDKFNKMIESGNTLATNILHAVTKPLADTLLMTFTLDPEIEKVVFTGGISHTLGSSYLQSLLYNLNKTGMYQITNRDQTFFSNRLFLGKDDDNSCLIGSALSFKYNI